MDNLAKIICGLLDEGTGLVLASIVSLQGSSPRHNGTKMVISADGKNYGTIGGSLLEASVIQESHVLLNSRESRFMDFELNGKDANSPEMICGGKAVVLLDYISASHENLKFFKQYQETIQVGRDFYLLTHIRSEGDTIRVIGRSLLLSDGRVNGSSSLSPSDIENLKSELHNLSLTTVIRIRDTMVAIDPIRKLKTLYCFGAGHVAVPTAHIAALVGFRVVVIDDRAEYANTERFPEAADVNVIQDFHLALERLEIDPDTYIVILTWVTCSTG